MAGGKIGDGRSEVGGLNLPLPAAWGMAHDGEEEKELKGVDGEKCPKKEVEPG